MCISARKKAVELVLGVEARALKQALRFSARDWSWVGENVKPDGRSQAEKENGAICEGRNAICVEEPRPV